MIYDTRSKILSREELATEVRRRQQAGERGVFTNGCFDLLHFGHLRYLQEARTLGDFLILGLNSDTSTRLLKGPGRPLAPETERAEILAALTKRIAAKDNPPNDLLLISCGLPDRAGYVCGLDRFMFKLIAENVVA